MKRYKYTPNNLAAGVTIILAVLFVTACANNPPPPPTKIAATIKPAATVSPTASPTQIQATVTPTPSLVPTQTSIPPTSTLTPTSIPPTSTPTITPNPPSPTPTLPPPTPTTEITEQPTPTPTVETPPSASVNVYETTITIPTYPVKEYLTEQIDPVYNIPVFYFNRYEYDAANSAPTPVDYAGVVLENPYLRLTFIPELGGRLYSAVIKSTGQEVFYHNPVVKPSRYGVLQPYEANWWLATGGMEWAYPTQEHGYRFGVAWEYNIDHGSDGAAGPDGAAITLSDTAPDRVGLTVQVTLPADSAAFTVVPKLVNNGPDNAPVQLWTNAVLALTSGSMSAQTQFVVSADTITVHSRGESGWSVPGELEQAPWPQVGPTDLRDYSQWANYLGFFVPNQNLPFIGAYNPATNLGIVRLAAPDATSGSGKLFAFGLNFPDRSYTDDDSQYFEIWGGANAGFWPKDDISVAVGQTLGWEEIWWPLAQLGGVTWTTDRVAIYLSQTGDTYTLSTLVSRPTQGTLRVSTGDVSLLTQSFSADPAAVLQWNFAAADETTNIRFVDNNGTVLLEYQAD